MMKYIVISGIDGSGKTTIINELQKKMREQGVKSYYIWMRYNHYLVKGLNALARILNLSVKTYYGAKPVWEHHYYKSKAFYKIYILCSYIDNKIASRKVKKINKGLYDYVIIDRWVNDIIADIGSEFRQPQIFTTRWYGRFQNILPENSVQFVIARPEGVLLDAREDNRYDINFNERFNLYKKMSTEGHATEVDNSGTISQSVQFILNRI